MVVEREIRVVHPAVSTARFHGNLPETPVTEEPVLDQLPQPVEVELPVERRKDWHYFYTREVPAEAARERRFMTTPNLLPARYRPFRLPSEEALRTTLAEPWVKELRTLAIWSYIYE